MGSVGPAADHVCSVQLEADPGGQHATLCLYQWGREEAREAEAGAYLTALSNHFESSGWPELYLGSLHWAEPERAAEHLGLAAERFASAEDLHGEFLARNHRAPALFYSGNVVEAEREAERAVELAETSGDPELIVQAQLTLARHLSMAGSNLERAHRVLVEVDRHLSPESAYAVRRDCWVTLGNVATELGRFSEARTTFGHLLSAALAEGDLKYEAAARYGLTRVAAEQLAEDPTERQRDLTLRLAEEALRASKAAGYSAGLSKAHWILGSLSSGAEAREHLERCAQIAPTAREKGYCLNALAREIAPEDPVAAARVSERALHLAREAGDAFSQAFAWRERMRMSWEVKLPAQAIPDSWAALQTIEALRDLQEDGSSVQAGLFSTWTDDYHYFAGQLLKELRRSARHDLVGTAFSVSERLRARALTDWLRATGQVSAAEERSGFTSLHEVQRALGPWEALLAFQVAPWEDLTGDFGGGSWVIAVTRGSARAYPLPGRSELRRAVDLYTGLFEGRDGSETTPSVHLYGQLLAPALADLPAGIDRLILVPDDALHRLPFGALRPAPDAPPLAATHRLSVAPSATLWLGWRRDARAGRVLRASTEAPVRAPALVLAAPTAPVDPSGSDLPPLRHARREGRAVAAALGGETELALGAGASEALLAGADLRRFGVLHLAAHAVTDEDHPERSAVVLTPSPAAEQPGEDGLLRAGEIASLDLGGKLVVLSSCRSAAGTVLRGEGVMSLGRAFFQAGARTVVASLWPVRDDETAALFESFYRHLARGETVAAALQAAQAERRAAGAPASAWAAFVVLGDGDLAPVAPAPPPDPRLRLALIAAGIFAALLLAVAAVALRRRLAAALAARRPRRQDLPDLIPSSPSPR